MKVKDLLKIINYKDVIVRINTGDDYYEYLKRDCDLLSNSILNSFIKEVIPLERRMEIYL